nr:immunoglobulin heavy chain junction region [Mus musculus]
CTRRETVISFDCW